MNFSEAMEKLNGIDLSDGKSCFICDRNDPQNYMEVSASLETHNDKQYVNTEFKVFNPFLTENLLIIHGQTEVTAQIRAKNIGTK